MRKRMFVVVVLCILMQGCVAIHYRNQKGVKADGRDFQTKVGTIEKGKVHFWSELEIWIPTRF